jgi:hypothetical protein
MKRQIFWNQQTLVRSHKSGLPVQGSPYQVIAVSRSAGYQPTALKLVPLSAQ